MEYPISILGFDTDETTGLPISYPIRRGMGLEQLECFLKDSSENTERGAVSQKRRLFLIKHPAINDRKSLRRLQDVLRDELGVPATSLFQAHRWSQTVSQFTEAINFPRLPTANIRPRSQFSLEYFELWDVQDDDMHFGDLLNVQMSVGTVECVATDRQIQCHKWIKRPGWLLIAPRKCSFWSRKHESGWDVVILCDVPPQRVLVNGETIDLALKPFQGGYHGFIPDDLKEWKQETPPQTSLFEDLAYYLKDHADLLPPDVVEKHPEAAAMFVKKIVASHYCQLLGFVSHQTPSMRAAGWAVQRKTQEQVDESNQVETAWSHFKCPEYLETLGSVLDSLCISQGRDPFDVLASLDRPAVEEQLAEESDTALETRPAPICYQPVRASNNIIKDQPGRVIDSSCQDWRSSVPDFLYLHREFRQHLAEYARMTSSLAALNGMIGGRISILEARTAKSLTLVAMLFAPPACVASIFSIPASIFGEKGPQFWWYWAAALPLTVLVFFLTYLIQERDVVKRSWRARRPKRHLHKGIPSTNV